MNSSVNQLETNQSPDIDLPSDAVPPSGKSSAGRWLLMALLICCTLGSVATLAFLWLTSLPPRTNCDEISPLSPDIDRLSCAQEAARSGELDDLMTGLELVESWPPEHPLHNEAQRWMAEWSKSVLVIARQKMADSDLKGAIELAHRVPKSSPSYADAQAAIKKWQGNWQIDQAIYARAQDALKQQDWDSVSQRILELSESPYRYWNSEKANELSQRILTEKKARQTLAQAKQLAQLATPQDIKTAIDRASQMDAKSYTWSESQPMLTQWGNTLLTVGLQRWREKQLDEAIGFARTVAAIPALTNEAQNLLKLSQARQLAVASDTRWKPTPKHIWNLMEATAAVQQIPADSRFYAQAQDSLKSWQAQLKDTTQLQYAQIMADTGQRDLVQTAIDQAKNISPDHPRRLQAQTLIAHWHNEVERLEDRPYLLFAQQLAKPGTIPALKSAIAEAKKVSMGRVLRGEAQGLIYQWTWQIQAIEDRPFLTMARLQADQGNLTEAIRAAATIRPGRALYYEAQAAISGWLAEMNRATIARTRREEQRHSSSSQSETDSKPSAIEDIQPLPWTIPADSNKLPKSDAATDPSLQPAAPSPQRTPQLPTVESEAPSPFVLQENTPLFEEAPPAADRNYDMDDVPRLINRGANHQNSPERQNRVPAASAPTRSAPTRSAPAEIFSAPPDAQLFEEANPAPPVAAPPAPVTDSAPPAATDPLVEQSAPPPTESSSLSKPAPTTESTLPQEAVPLSMNQLGEVAPSIGTTADPTATPSPDKDLPLSMNTTEPGTQL